MLLYTVFNLLKLCFFRLWSFSIRPHSYEKLSNKLNLTLYISSLTHLSNDIRLVKFYPISLLICFKNWLDYKWNFYFCKLLVWILILLVNLSLYSKLLWMLKQHWDSLNLTNHWKIKYFVLLLDFAPFKFYTPPFHCWFNEWQKVNQMPTP